MAKNFGSGVGGGVVLIDPATGQPYKATGGGGGGVSSWDDLEDKPAIIAAGATAEAARAAIDLADVAASGSYNDLTDTPDIPSTATWSTLDGKPAVIAAGEDAPAARSAIGAAPVTPAASIGLEYAIAYSVAASLGARPSLPTGATLRIWGGTIADSDPTWMIDGDYRDIPVA